MWALNRILKDKLKKPVENTEYTDVFLDFLDGEDGDDHLGGNVLGQMASHVFLLILKI